MNEPRDRRFWSALIFSAACLVAVPLLSRTVDVVLGPDQLAQGLAMMVFGFGLALGAVFAIWLLTAALLERRPALRDPRGRLLWVWTLIFCAAFLALGAGNRSTGTVGATVLFATGWVVALVGAVGLVASAIPRLTRKRSDSLGR